MAAFALASLQAVNPARAEEPGTFSERVEVELVNIEAWVTDGDGKPVRGLGRDAFTLLHDGAPVPITHFSEITQGAPRRTVPADKSLEGGATDKTPLVVVIDLFRLTQSSQKRLMRNLRSFVAAGDVAAELVLILKLEGRLSVAAPFGSSADELDAALAALEKRAPNSADMAADHRQVVQALDDLWTDLNRSSASTSIRSVVNQVIGPTASQGAAATSGGDPGSPGPAASSSGIACDDFADRAKPVLVRWADKERVDMTATLERLGDVASFLSGLEGPKTMLYVSDGLGLAPGTAATDFVRGVCPAYQTDLEVDTLPGAMGNEFEELARRMSSNRVTVYAIQGSGLTGALGGTAGQTSSDRRGLRSFERSSSRNARQGLALLSERTGGRFVPQAAANERELAAIASEMNSYYSLAYTPPAAGSTRNHEIAVQLADPALEVRHRRSFSDKSPEQWLTERLESALYLGMVTNPLAVRLAAGDVAPGDPGLVSLPLHVMVPVEQLAFPDRDGRPMAQLLIRIMALHAENRTLVMTDRPMFLPRPGEGTLDVFDLKVDVQLEAGLQMMAIAVQDKVSGEASFVSTTIEISSPDANS